MRNILLRALGTEADVRVDVRSQALIPGDVLLLCTDGLNRMVSDGGIARALQESADPRACCERLVREAREAGGRDNVTVVVARIIGRGSGEGRARR